MVKDDKDNIIKELMNLRTSVGEIETSENADRVSTIQRQINKIHDMVFGI